MINLEQAARMALEAQQLCANGEGDVLLTSATLSALRALERPKQETVYCGTCDKQVEQGCLASRCRPSWVGV